MFHSRSTKVEHIRSGISLFHSEFTSNSSHAQMIGILVSSETIEQGYTAGDSRYPRLKDIPALVNASAGEALITIHYDNRNGNRESAYRDINQLMEFSNVYTSELCYGVQFNASHYALPQPNIVAKLREAWGLKIIIPLQKLPSNDADSREAVDRVCTNYGGIADYFLIDQSAGNGVKLDMAKSVNVYSELMDQNYGGIVCFAGGINGSNAAEIVKSLRDRTLHKAFQHRRRKRREQHS